MQRLLSATHADLSTHPTASCILVGSSKATHWSRTSGRTAPRCQTRRMGWGGTASESGSNGASSSLQLGAETPTTAPPPPAPPLLTNWLPLAILTDSYKASHFLQYPPGVQRMSAVCGSLCPPWDCL